MTSFYRLSGGGNDFLALVEPAEIPAAASLAAWCRRGVSLGADGVFVLDRPGDVLRVRHFNADGGPAELCLNGTRCAVRLAQELGWVASTDRFPLITGAGQLQARVSGQDSVRIELPVPEQLPSRCKLVALGEEHDGWEARVGVPHFVLQVESGLADKQLAELGPALRFHPRFPRGANVNWIELCPGGFAIRTWERGVEAETLACGTGVLAAVACGIAASSFEFPLRVRTRGGFVFSVEGTSESGEVRSWSLTGDARLVAQGKILPGALARPH